MVFAGVIKSFTALDVAQPLAFVVSAEDDLESVWARFMEAGDVSLIGPALVRDGGSVIGYIAFDGLSEQDFAGRTMRDVFVPLSVWSTAPHDTLLIDALRLIADIEGPLFLTQLNEITHVLYPSVLLQSMPMRHMLMTLMMQLETGLRELASSGMAHQLTALLPPARQRYLREQYSRSHRAVPWDPPEGRFASLFWQDPWVEILRDLSSYRDLVSAVCRHSRLVQLLDLDGQESVPQVFAASIAVRNKVAHGLPIPNVLPTASAVYAFVIAAQRLCSALPDARRQLTGSE